jgi:hypothetical protein
MESGAKPPDKKHWRGNWDESQAKRILELAAGYRIKYGVDMRTAWMSAEQDFCNQRDPSFGKALKR